MKRKDLEQVFDDMSSPSSSKSRRLDANSIGNPSSAFQVFDQRPLKRKEFEEAFNDMSSHFSKSRRLDADIYPTMADGRSNGIESLERRLAQVQALAVASQMQQGGLPMEPVALSEDNDKALVLYNPASALYRTPASTDFSIVVNSDLIPGLRAHLLAQGKWAKPADTEESGREDSNGCLAIVPWVESNWPASPRTETQVASVSEPMQADEVEMMDTDISSDASKPSEQGPMTDRSFELQRWQQEQQQQLHCMQPQPLNNTYTPVATGLNFFSW